MTTFFRISALALVVLALGTIAASHYLRARESDAIASGPVGPIDEELAARIVADAHELRSAAVVVSQGGEEIFGWGDVDVPLDIRSIRKSALNYVLGRLVREGRLDLDATLAELGIDDEDFALNEIERGATVRQLMEARSGVYHLAARETSSAAQYRPGRGEYAPGEFWYYNNWDFNALETIAAQAAGDDDYCATFARYLGEPLGLAAPLERCEVQGEDVSIHAAHAISLSARELVTLARLFLDEAKAPEQLPEGWVAWSTQSVSDFHFIDDSRFNYGRLFWVIDPYAGIAEPSYMMRGAGSIYVWTVPGEDLVLVHQVRTSPLLLRTRLGLTPDDNDAWTFGGRVLCAVLGGEYAADPLY